MRTLLSTDRHRMHSTGISPLIVTGFEGGVVGDYSTYTSFLIPSTWRLRVGAICAFASIAQSATATVLLAGGR